MNQLNAFMSDELPQSIRIKQIHPIGSHHTNPLNPVTSNEFPHINHMVYANP
jgi:hypothetical protein